MHDLIRRTALCHSLQRGKGHAYALGRLLRRRYGCFLGEEMTPDLMELRSTTVPRAQHSGALVLAGLMPPAPNQQWGQDSGSDDRIGPRDNPSSSLGRLWQPVCFQTVPVEAVSMTIRKEKAPLIALSIGADTT